MSIAICKNCQDCVDSDDDPDCFVEIGNMRRQTETIVLCERCRFKDQDEREYQESMTP